MVAAIGMRPGDALPVIAFTLIAAMLLAVTAKQEPLPGPLLIADPLRC